MRLGLIGSLVATMLILGAFPTLASTQDDPSPTSPGAGRYLPLPDLLGDGWVVVQQMGVDPDAALFREGVNAVYGGPAGARAVLFVWVIQDSTTAVRRSWEAIDDLMGSYRYEFASDDDWSEADRIDGLDPPSGCIEAKRAESTDPKSTFPAGLTMCAIDPDVILLAIVSGGLGGKTGYPASDALIALALEEATGSADSPTPAA